MLHDGIKHILIISCHISVIPSHSLTTNLLLTLGLFRNQDLESWPWFTSELKLGCLFQPFPQKHPIEELCACLGSHL